MDKEWKERWIVALRSGQYNQGLSALYNEDTNSFCCLGVLRDIVHPNITYGCISDDTDEQENTYQLESCHSKGLQTQEAIELARMNDEGKTFLEIADYIEKNIKGEEFNLCL